MKIVARLASAMPQPTISLRPIRSARKPSGQREDGVDEEEDRAEQTKLGGVELQVAGDGLAEAGEGEALEIVDEVGEEHDEEEVRGVARGAFDVAARWWIEAPLPHSWWLLSRVLHAPISTWLTAPSLQGWLVCHPGCAHFDTPRRNSRFYNTANAASPRRLCPSLSMFLAALWSRCRLVPHSGQVCQRTDKPF